MKGRKKVITKQTLIKLGDITDSFFYIAMPHSIDITFSCSVVCVRIRVAIVNIVIIFTIIFMSQ